MASDPSWQAGVESSKDCHKELGLYLALRKNEQLLREMVDWEARGRSAAVQCRLILMQETIGSQRYVLPVTHTGVALQ